MTVILSVYRWIDTTHFARRRIPGIKQIQINVTNHIKLKKSIFSAVWVVFKFCWVTFKLFTTDFGSLKCSFWDMQVHKEFWRALTRISQARTNYFTLLIGLERRRFLINLPMFYRYHLKCMRSNESHGDRVSAPTAMTDLLYRRTLCISVKLMKHHRLRTCEAEAIHDGWSRRHTSDPTSSLRTCAKSIIWTGSRSPYHLKGTKVDVMIRFL